ncbi:hypothetical protein ABPG74_022613 [Tetrahymena malaccensis]
MYQSTYEKIINTNKLIQNKEKRENKLFLTLSQETKEQKAENCAQIFIPSIITTSRQYVDQQNEIFISNRNTSILQQEIKILNNTKSLQMQFISNKKRIQSNITSPTLSKLNSDPFQISKFQNQNNFEMLTYKSQQTSNESLFFTSNKNDEETYGTQTERTQIKRLQSHFEQQFAIYESFELQQKHINSFFDKIQEFQKLDIIDQRILTSI